jgi:hypothetical protein
LLPIATDFTVCALLLDVAGALWGPVIPAVNVNILRVLSSPPLMPELPMHSEMLVGALPEAASVVNSIKNQMRADSVLLKNCTAQMWAVNIAAKHEVSTDPDNARTVMKHSDNVLKHLDALNGVMSLKDDTVQLWLKMYTSAYQTLLIGLRAHQDSR